MAHEFAWHSIALAQALQFELMLRQKDVIGEWVPVAEPGDSGVEDAGQKWLRGLRWDEIDQNMVLRHVTSKRQKEIEIDLSSVPMVIEELALIPRRAAGPIVICEVTGLPYSTAEFRRKWRLVANAAGVPKSVRNMDSRAGAISEATDAGADLEHVRHAATHSDIAMTQKYSRNATEKIAGVHALRAAHRNRTTA
jgi:site-specific recombinase XerD